MLTKKRKRELDVDLWIIAIVSFAILAIYGTFNSQINGIIRDSSINIVWRVLFVGGVFQFGLAGLGITIVSIIRKESFIDYGLTCKNFWLTAGLSALCCLPDFIYNLIAGNIQGWLPFSTVNTTAEVLASGFPANVLGMLITAICWGFFEGFNYVVIADKISERYPSKYKLLDWGAFICAVFCILIHGAIGVTPEAFIEMLCVIFMIYGMLVVRKVTGNAWGCILIFLFYWNAI